MKAYFDLKIRRSDNFQSSKLMKNLNVKSEKYEELNQKYLIVMKITNVLLTICC